MALASLVHYGDRLKAGIDYVGISNFVTFLEKTSPYRQDLRRVEYGDERVPEMRTFLEEISPVAHADKITSPLLVIQGSGDPRVPQNEAEQIIAAVRKNNGTAWYLLAKNEGHGFAKKENRDAASGAMAVFLQQFLLGK
jgi:dipeptidyl aminopeptidase/acylaminoacyl peptidase